MSFAVVRRKADRLLPWLLALYAGASLVHFAHNAEYLAQYPHLPPSWTRGEVYLAWCCMSALGVFGFSLNRGGFGRLLSGMRSLSSASDP